MATPFLRQILSSISEAGVRFVVGGGVAAVLHGVERVTMDLDLALDMQPENLIRFLAVMRRNALTPRVPAQPEVLLDPAAVRMIVEEKQALVFTFHDVDHPTRQVDIFLAEHVGYKALFRESVEVEVWGHRVRIVSLQKLLELKERIDPPRPKDILDIQELRRLLRRTSP